MTERLQGFVHGRFRRGGWGPEPVPRTMQVLRLEDPDDGAHCVIGHFHGLRDPLGKQDTEARAAQARRALSMMQGLAGPGEAMVMGGDFNILPGSAAFDLWREAGLEDQVAAHGIEDTRTSLYTKPGRHASYMLTGGALRVERFEAPAEPLVSDHRPLVLQAGIG